ASVRRLRRTASGSNPMEAWCCSSFPACRYVATARRHEEPQAAARNSAAYDGPVAYGHGSQVALRWLDRAAIHRVEIILAGGGVKPEQIGLSIAVVIAHCRDLPRQVGNGVQPTPFGRTAAMPVALVELRPAALQRTDH